MAERVQLGDRVFLSPLILCHPGHLRGTMAVPASRQGAHPIPPKQLPKTFDKSVPRKLKM